jgi:hypothetical protein
MSKNADAFGRRPSVFSCLKSVDFRQEGVIPNSLCHISDEMRHSPLSSLMRLDRSKNADAFFFCLMSDEARQVEER